VTLRVVRFCGFREGRSAWGEFFNHGAQAELAGEAQRRQRGGGTFGVGQHVLDHELEGAAFHTLVFAQGCGGDLGAYGFDEVVILHAGGTGGFARAADEAAVEVFEDDGAGGDFAVGDGFHQVDAAAWGVGFIEGFEIGGADGEAKAAMDAGVELGVGLGRQDDGELHEGWHRAFGEVGGLYREQGRRRKVK